MGRKKKEPLLDSNFPLSTEDIKALKNRLRYTEKDLREIKRELLRSSDEYELLQRIRAVGFIERAWGVIGKCFSSMEKQDDLAISPKDAVKVIDTLITKIRLIQGESTSISEMQVKSLSDENVDKEILKLERLLKEDSRKELEEKKET